MRAVRALLIVVLLLGGLFVGADRVIAAVAADRIADKLQQRLELNRAPDVSINGFPLLTQALAGTYDEIEVSAKGLVVQGYRDLELDVRLREIDLPLSKLIKGEIDGAVAKHAEATVRVPESTISIAAGQNVEVKPSSDGGITMTTKFDLLGSQVPVTITANASIEDGKVRLDVTEASAANVELPKDAVAALSKSLALKIPTPKLPAGLTLQSVSAEDGALIATATGTDIPLTS